MKARCISVLYAFLMEGEHGEGIPFVLGPDGREHLLVDADEQLVEWAAPRLLAAGQKFRIVRFERGEDVTEEFLP